MLLDVGCRPHQAYDSIVAQVEENVNTFYAKNSILAKFYKHNRDKNSKNHDIIYVLIFTFSSFPNIA